MTDQQQVEVGMGDRSVGKKPDESLTSSGATVPENGGPGDSPTRHILSGRRKVAELLLFGGLTTLLIVTMVPPFEFSDAATILALIISSLGSVAVVSRSTHELRIADKATQSVIDAGVEAVDRAKREVIRASGKSVSDARRTVLDVGIKAVEGAKREAINVATGTLSQAETKMVAAINEAEKKAVAASQATAGAMKQEVNKAKTEILDAYGHSLFMTTTSSMLSAIALIEASVAPLENSLLLMSSKSDARQETVSRIGDRLNTCLKRVRRLQ